MAQATASQAAAIRDEADLEVRYEALGEVAHHCERALDAIQRTRVLDDIGACLEERYEAAATEGEDALDQVVLYGADDAATALAELAGTARSLEEEAATELRAMAIARARGLELPADGDGEACAGCAAEAPGAAPGAIHIRFGPDGKATIVRPDGRRPSYQEEIDRLVRAVWGDTGKKQKK